MGRKSDKLEHRQTHTADTHTHAHIDNKSKKQHHKMKPKTEHQLDLHIIKLSRHQAAFKSSQKVI